MNEKTSSPRASPKWWAYEEFGELLLQDIAGIAREYRKREWVTTATLLAELRTLPGRDWASLLAESDAAGARAIWGVLRPLRIRPRQVPRKEAVGMNSLPNGLHIPTFFRNQPRYKHKEPAVSFVGLQTREGKKAMSAAVKNQAALPLDKKRVQQTMPYIAFDKGAAMLGLTERQLSEKLGYAPHTWSSWKEAGAFPKVAWVALDALLSVNAAKATKGLALVKFGSADQKEAFRVVANSMGLKVSYLD